MVEVMTAPPFLPPFIPRNRRLINLCYTVRFALRAEFPFCYNLPRLFPFCYNRQLHQARSFAWRILETQITVAFSLEADLTVEANRYRAVVAKQLLDRGSFGRRWCDPLARPRTRFRQFLRHSSRHHIVVCTHVQIKATKNTLHSANNSA